MGFTENQRNDQMGTWLRVGLCLLALLCAPAMQAKTKRRHVVRKHVTAGTPAQAGARTTTRAAVIRTGAGVSTKVSLARKRRTKRVFFNPWTEPTYADSTIGDNIDAEDIAVRKAAVDALGPYNGTVVVSDPTSGRILSMVNQKLALKGAFQPCSTVKVMVSLASLHEGIVDPGTPVRLTRRFSMDMTRAIATSNNMYFAHLGQELGFERVHKYGELFGLGEKAGLDIAGEEPGSLAEATPQSGVGMMTSFGDGIRLTPLELTGIIGAVANGGTLYYLQYPRTQDEADRFVPRIKRELDIDNLVSEIRPGMMGAVEYGTARRANFDSSPIIYGKTGTCTDTTQPGVHLGWFGSFTEVGNKKLSVVVLLTGGRGISGPIASGVAGNVYRNLAQAHYFDQAGEVPTSLVSTQTLVRQ
jgi:cell division protein FtsI/penicillin-binding protein 2